jgi:hypothetical protein
VGRRGWVWIISACPAVVRALCRTSGAAPDVESLGVFFVVGVAVMRWALRRTDAEAAHDHEKAGGDACAAPKAFLTYFLPHRRRLAANVVVPPKDYREAGNARALMTEIGSEMLRPGNLDVRAFTSGQSPGSAIFVEEGAVDNLFLEQGTEVFRSSALTSARTDVALIPGQPSKVEVAKWLRSCRRMADRSQAPLDELDDVGVAPAVKERKREGPLQGPRRRTSRRNTPPNVAFVRWKSLPNVRILSSSFLW